MVSQIAPIRSGGEREGMCSSVNEECTDGSNEKGLGVSLGVKREAT